jgi:hypothetical protein
MGTIDDITFDRNYSHATFRFLLLNEQNLGPTPAIILRHVPLMTFIDVFRNLIQCQQNINNDNRKMITLVVSDRNISKWHDQINVIDRNIDKVYIFCETYSDYLAMKKWNGCYREKIQDVYLPDTFEYELLRLGVDYIHKIMPEFRQERGLYRRFGTDARRLLAALDDYFEDQINSLDDGATGED